MIITDMYKNRQARATINAKKHKSPKTPDRNKLPIRMNIYEILWLTGSEQTAMISRVPRYAGMTTYKKNNKAQHSHVVPVSFPSRSRLVPRSYPCATRVLPVRYPSLFVTLPPSSTTGGRL